MPTVAVELCYQGHDRFAFRLTLPCGARESVRGEEWTRALAAQAKDLLANVYGLPRDRIRFSHR